MGASLDYLSSSTLWEVEYRIRERLEVLWSFILFAKFPRGRAHTGYPVKGLRTSVQSLCSKILLLSHSLFSLFWPPFCIFIYNCWPLVSSIITFIKWNQSDYIKVFHNELRAEVVPNYSIYQSFMQHDSGPEAGPSKALVPIIGTQKQGILYANWRDLAGKSLH